MVDGLVNGKNTLCVFISREVTLITKYSIISQNSIGLQESCLHKDLSRINPC